MSNTNVVFIDSSVVDYEDIVKYVKSVTIPIVYTSNTSKTEVLNTLRTQFNSIKNIAVVSYSQSMFLEGESFFTDANTSFIINIIKEFKVENIHYLACNSLKDPMWVEYYETIKRNTSVVVGASNDKTGNIVYGGNWEMENIATNIENIYFTKSIEAYKYLLDISNHTCIVLGGKVFSCGNNANGQLGTGTTISRSVFIAMIMPSGKTASTVSCSTNHTVVQMTDGTVFSCGFNGSGQLGDGTTTQRNTLVPMIIPSGKTASMVSCGSNHTVVTMTDGTVFSCGTNGSGQLGDGTLTGRNTLVPMIMPVGKTASMVSCGSNHTVVTMTDGTVFSCGTNGNAQLGDGTYTQRNTLVPMIMPSGKSASSVACGQYHTVVRMTDGTVFSCGYPYYGTFGDNITNTIGTLLVPMIMPSGKSASAVSATGFLSTVVRMTDGTVFSCGYNSNGQLGDGTTTQRNTLVPMIIPSGKTAENVFCGNNHTVVVMTDGTVFSCGWNGSGQLGDGTTTQRNTLVRIYIITDTSTSNILPMYNAGVPLSAMLLNGITISQMFNVGITLVQMLAGNITTSQMFNGGITIAQMLSAGITLSQMFNGGITIAQMLTAGITIAQMFNGGITLSQMFNGGITITQMFAANITITQMFNGGITISQMLAANITIAQMLTAGITLSQMFNGGITIAQMFNGGITLSQMFNGGIAATYFRPINVLFYKRDTYGDTWNGNVINIRNKSTGQVLTTLTLTTYGQNWSYDTGSLYYGVEYEITKVIGSFAYEVLYAITTSSVTSYNGSQTTISEGTDVILAQQTNAFPSLKIMDFSLTSNPFNISATQLKAAGYTATELKAAGYTQQEITGAGYSQTTNPSITNFGNLSKTVADSSFTIVAPSSTSTGAFSYTSSNPLVATISGSTVTILQAGTTTITALQEETSTYYRASISCTLTVISKVASNLLIGSVSAKKLGDAVFTLPVTTNSTGSISYTSSVPSVATISSVGLVTIVGAGSTVLTVSQLTDANYLAGSVTYTLTIEKTTSSLSMGSISEKTNGDVPFALVVTTNSTGVISYTSSNTSVATISNTGLVTIVGAGSTVLTVSQLTDANYLAKSVEGMLTVKESSSSNPTVISGGSGLSYFLNTSATYAILSGDISVSSGSLQSISKKVIKASKKMTIKRS